MSKLDYIIATADIHATRIKRARQQLAGIFSIDQDKLTKLSEEQFLFIELLKSRFAALQNLMGAKLIDAFLEAKGEVTDNLTMIDKLHKLERLNMINDSTTWLGSVDIYLSHR